ncbi:CvpA family protein [Lacibacterium aquatile]|uniref:CvpA family protein n=1 Tax=Lacibacterium aquatile TaxID=1168082 RepID=A0ABW5DQN2_9PROT
MNGGLTMADMAVIIIILVSGVLAFLRGFVREALGIAAWVGAAFAAVWLYPFVQPLALELIGMDVVANPVAWVSIFLIALVLLSILASALASQVKSSHLSALDRSLGFVFGLFRGAVLVSLAFFLATLIGFVKPAEPPIWLAQARTFPLIQQGADMISVFVPKDQQARSAAQAEEAKRKVEQVQDAKRAFDALNQPAPKPAPNDPSGYNQQDRNKLDQLIQAK